MTVVVICVLVAISALLYIYMPGKLYLGPKKNQLTYLRERKEAVYENLRDLNFECKAGKLPGSDYQWLKFSLEEEAAAILAEIARLEQDASSATSALRNREGTRV